MGLLIVSMIYSFRSHFPHGRTIILLYMDDMLITGDDYDYITFVKAHLSEQFYMSNLDPLSYFLGIEVMSTPDNYYLF
jgi:hypothetical protein